MIENLGSILSRARLKKGLSQPQLEIKSGIKQKDISLIENGAFSISIRRLIQLLDAVDLKLTIVQKSKAKLIEKLNAQFLRGEETSSVALSLVEWSEELSIRELGCVYLSQNLVGKLYTTQHHQLFYKSLSTKKYRSLSNSGLVDLMCPAWLYSMDVSSGTLINELLLSGEYRFSRNIIVASRASNASAIFDPTNENGVPIACVLPDELTINYYRHPSYQTLFQILSWLLVKSGTEVVEAIIALDIESNEYWLDLNRVEVDLFNLDMTRIRTKTYKAQTRLIRSQGSSVDLIMNELDVASLPKLAKKVIQSLYQSSLINPPSVKVNAVIDRPEPKY